MVTGDPSKSLSDAEHAEAILAFSKLGLCTQLAEAAAALGWKGPTAIQEQSIPPLLEGEQAPILPVPASYRQSDGVEGVTLSFRANLFMTVY